MLLTKLVVRHYGPFAIETEITFETGVTVFTGANDTGKTSLLTLVERLCGIKGSEQVIQDTEVNLDRIGDAPSSWEEDKAISCDAFFRGTGYSSHHIAGDWGRDDELHVLCTLPPKARSLELKRFRKAASKQWSKGGSVAVKSMPTVIRLPGAEPIRTIIDLEAPNACERAFLQAAFGPQFSYEKYSNMPDGTYYSLMAKARGDINARLRALLPPALSMDFDFQSVRGERQRLSLQLRDSHSGHTPLGMRGAGVQRLISLMALLSCNPLEAGHYIILLDEPETSLHADAQHTFRATLEALADRENIQVVYATHSPSMINTAKPDSLRVLARTQKDNRATTEIITRPFDGNFLAVRSTLGVTPGDSLLYAPVVLIVEGATEGLGIPLALSRLHKAGIHGFEDVPFLHSQMHVIDGCGDSFEYLCRMAKSQGAKPIIFLDGDKAPRIAKVRERHKDVPIVLLDDRQEFEELVRNETYFAAMRDCLPEFAESGAGRLTVEEYATWESTADLPIKMVFTKRIERWLQDTFDGLSLNKTNVMKRALEIEEPAEIRVDKLRDILTEVRRLLS